jgi:hypothetical protein
MKTVSPVAESRLLHLSSTEIVCQQSHAKWFGEAADVDDVELGLESR